MVIAFPKRIKYAKDNPIIDFYKKCMKSAFDRDSINGVNVCAFSVNPTDYKKLKNLLKKHTKKKYPYLKGNVLKIEVNMYLLDLGPVEDSKIKKGSVNIKVMELYDEYPKS